MESDCNEDAPECICPCGCGCQNGEGGKDLPFTDKIGGTVELPLGELGFCRSCAEGFHEVPPEEVRSIDTLIAAHESVLAQLKRLKNIRSKSNDNER